MVEGDSGTKLATFTIALSGPSSSPVSFDIRTNNGSAADDIDYVPKSTLGQSIAAGQTSGTFAVTIIGDTLVEANETFTATVSNVVGATVADAQARGTITNNDNAVLSIADTTLAEGNNGISTASFIIELSSPMPTAVSFNVATSNGTATAGSDYTALNEVGRTIDAGRTRVLFEVTIAGDTAAEASETFNAALSGVVGATLGDGAAVATIQNDDGAAQVTIAQIQGGSLLSPLVNREVETQGIVTARLAQGFTLQTADAAQDSDASTSEGLHVVSSDDANAIGDTLRVRGLVQEAPVGDDPNQLTLTRLLASEVAVVSHGNALPRAVPLDADRVGNLESYEGMRVSVPNLAVVAPDGGSIEPETGELRGTGRFHGLLPGASPGGRLLVDSLGQRGAVALSVDFGDNISGLVGVLGYGNGAYELLPDPAAAVSVVSGANPKPASRPTAVQMTVASLDLRRAFNDGATSTQHAPGMASQTIRLAKTAEVICSYIRNPAIVGVTGIDSPSTIEDLAAAANGNAGNELFAGSCSNDAAYRVRMAATSGRGRLGFLVSTAEVRPGVPRVVVQSVSTPGIGQAFRNRDGRREPLHEHAPLLLRARINSAAGEAVDVTVVAVQLSAMDGNLRTSGPHGWATRGDYLRARRSAQALAIARVVQARQQANPGEKLIVLGDFDASEFGDGRSEPMGLLTGPASPVWPPLLNTTSLVPAPQRYTVTRDGSAVALGHILVNRALLSAYPDLHLEMARVNADFGVDNAGDAMVPVRAAERDPQVLYLQGQ